MKTAIAAGEDLATRGDSIYERKIGSRVETTDNIGKMIVIDVESEDYEIDELGVAAARILQSRHPDAVLYGKRIGYNVAATFGGIMKRTSL